MTVRGYLWGRLSGLGLAVAACVMLIDRLHKWFMLGPVGIHEGRPIPVTSFFNLVLVWNRGVSYGLFQQESATGRAVLIAINVAAAVILWIWLARARYGLIAVSIGLVIGGAVSNAIDRALYGAVADFFHFHAFGYSWYVFNIADVAIVAGVVGLLYESFLDSHKSAQKTD